VEFWHSPVLLPVLALFAGALAIADDRSLLARFCRGNQRATWVERGVPRPSCPHSRTRSMRRFNLIWGLRSAVWDGAQDTGRWALARCLAGEATCDLTGASMRTF
jgi:hypothetical protein